MTIPPATGIGLTPRQDGPPICPHCGYDLRQDEPITIGDAHFDPASGFSWRGDKIHFSPNERLFVSTLMKAGGRLISNAVMVERLDIDHVKEPVEHVRVYATRIRKILIRAGAGRLFENDWGQGLRWIMPVQLAEAA